MWDDRGMAAGYLAGIIDGEGYIRDPDRNGTSRMVQIANTDEDIIEATCDALDVFGIRHTVSPWKHSAGKSPIKYIQISGKNNLKRLYSIVPIRSRRKEARLHGHVFSQRRNQHIVRDDLSKEALTSAYATMTMKEMASHFGVSLNSIVRAMNHHGIPRVSGTDRANRVWKSRRENRNAREASQKLE